MSDQALLDRIIAPLGHARIDLPLEGPRSAGWEIDLPAGLIEVTRYTEHTASGAFEVRELRAIIPGTHQLTARARRGPADARVFEVFAATAAPR